MVVTQRSEMSTILRSLSWPVRLFVIAWVLLAVYWQCLAHRNGIFGEMWDTLPAYRVLGELGFSGITQELLRKYAFVHIIALPKLGFWIDFHFFGASGQFTRASSFLVSVFCSALLVVIAVRTYQRTTVCVLLGALLFLNGFQTYVINWESLLQYYLAVFFALLAFMAYDRKPAQLALPSLFLLLSGLSCGASIAAVAAFVFMVLVRYREGVKPSNTALIVFAGFVLLLLYMLYPEANGASQQTQWPFFWHAPGLLLQYLAFPFSAWGDFRWVGLLVLFSVMHSVWVCVVLRRGLLPDYLLVFFFLIASTVVLGRYKIMGMEGDVSRYYVYMAPLWYFSLLKLLVVNDRAFRWATAIFCALLLVCSLASVAVLGNLANKMEMARTVALNGNFKHFASQRLDAIPGMPVSLQNSNDYLRANNMDIYYQRETVITPGTEATCHATLLRQAVTSKGGFVDYILTENPANASRLAALYLADEAGNIVYYGTPFAAVTHLAGWSVALRDVRGSDWPLLLPLSWLPLEQRLLYLHLPRSVPLDSLPAWGQDYRGNVCRLTISLLQE